MADKLADELKLCRTENNHLVKEINNLIAENRLLLRRIAKLEAKPKPAKKVMKITPRLSNNFRSS